MSNRMVYQEKCPDCAIEGKQEPLFLDMDTVQIRCENGHTFDELPSDTALRNAPPKNAETLQSEPPASEKNSEIASVSGPAAEGVAGMLASTLEELKSPEAGTARLEEIAAKMAPAEPETVAQKPAIVTKVAIRPMAEGDQVFVGEGGAVVLPNGDLLLALRIPEVWRSAVEAEAEAQLKSPAAYFADWLTSEEMKAAIVDALVNYWSSSYTQTI